MDPSLALHTRLLLLLLLLVSIEVMRQIASRRQATELTHVISHAWYPTSTQSRKALTKLYIYIHTYNDICI